MERIGAIKDGMFEINPETGRLVVVRNSAAEFAGAPLPPWAITPDDPGAAERAAAGLNNRENIIAIPRRTKKGAK